MVSDKDLLAQYKTNPEAGFQKIVEQFQERVYWQIRRLLKNHEDTADVMQNVFIKVWKGLSDFREDAALYTWIYRIAFNESHTFLSKASKKSGCITTTIGSPLMLSLLKYFLQSKFLWSSQNFENKTGL